MTKEDIKNQVEKLLNELRIIEGSEGIVTDWFLGYAVTRYTDEGERECPAGILTSNSNPFTLLGLSTYISTELFDANGEE